MAAKMPSIAFQSAHQITTTAIPRPLICRRYPVSMKRTVDASGTEFIRLDNFIKLQGGAATGGQAKMMITGGAVIVNGDVETRRGRKLRQGDTVTVDGNEIPVVFDEDQDA